MAPPTPPKQKKVPVLKPPPPAPSKRKRVAALQSPKKIVAKSRCEKIIWGRDGYPRRCDKLVVVSDPPTRSFCRPHIPAYLTKSKFRAPWNRDRAPTNPVHTPVGKMLARMYTPIVRAVRCEGRPHTMLLSIDGTPLKSLLYDNKRSLVYAVKIEGDPDTRELTWDELHMCRDLGIDTTFPYDWSAIRPEGSSDI